MRYTFVYDAPTPSDELRHYGVKGMKWGKHLFGKDKLKGTVRKASDSEFARASENLTWEQGHYNEGYAEYVRAKEALEDVEVAYYKVEKSADDKKARIVYYHGKNAAIQEPGLWVTPATPDARGMWDQAMEKNRELDKIRAERRKDYNVAKTMMEEFFSPRLEKAQSNLAKSKMR